jgi:uncharacterized protein (TIGR01777 family)
MSEYRRSATISAPQQDVFSWHRRRGAFERLAPPWQPTRVVGTTGTPPTPGAEVRLRVKVGPFWLPWTATHGDWAPDAWFTDQQVSGPFAAWHHTHRFEAMTDKTTRLDDIIDYRLPLGPAGALGRGYARHQIDRMFRYRHRVTADDIAWHQHYAARPMRLAMTGASGLVGAALTAFLRSGNHQVTQLVRRPTDEPDTVPWDANNRTWPPHAFDGTDAVIHLAGENIAGGRWTAARKQRILESRVDGTRRLCETLAGLSAPPATLVTASAIGFYGDRAETVDESSTPGEGFLPEVCQAWEEATAPARACGIRVVHLRLGIVLTPAGGALKQMLPLFRLGVGGMLGSGEQVMSWVALDDVLGSVLHVLATDAVSGPVNVVAPAPVTNRVFTKSLGRVLHRPTVLPAPGLALRLVLGEMAEALLLTGANVVPTRLTESGFRFAHPTLEGALRHLLGRSDTEHAGDVAS